RREASQGVRAGAAGVVDRLVDRLTSRSHLRKVIRQLPKMLVRVRAIHRLDGVPRLAVEPDMARRAQAVVEPGADKGMREAVLVRTSLDHEAGGGCFIERLEDIITQAVLQQRDFEHLTDYRREAQRRDGRLRQSGQATLDDFTYAAGNGALFE